MKKLIYAWVFLGLMIGIGFGLRSNVLAIDSVPLESTSSSMATESAQVVEEVKPKDDLTEPKEAKSRLERVLDSKVVGELKVTNFLQVAIRNAVERGVPVNMIVLMMLFPLVAALIAAARHIVGLQGFGLFTPAVISVAFLATGVTVGLFMFVGILMVATLGRVILKKLRLPSLPRMALLLWFVAIGVLGVLLGSPYLRLEAIMNLSIFPVLLLILLAETFIEVQISTSFKTALQQTAQTLLLALVSYLVISTQALQEWVLLNPEVAVLGIALVDVFIGKYSGLRLLERWRFRKLVTK